jgi:hypothetical protein
VAKALGKGVDLPPRVEIDLTKARSTVSFRASARLQAGPGA